MSIFNDKALKGVAEAAAKIMAETSHGTHPKTPKEKSLAALAHPKDKITHKDVLVGRGVLKKEEKEQLQEYESKDGKYTHKGTYGREKGAKYGESDYSKGGEEEKEAEKAMKSPKRASKGYGARQNMGMRGQSTGEKKKKVNESLSFTEMLELYNEHGLKVLAPIETEEMDIDGTTVEVIDADQVNGIVETAIEEEATEEEFNKELKDQQDSFAGKKKQPKVAAGKTTGVKVMPEETELDEEIHSPGTKVRVPHKGKMVSGKVVRHDKGSGGYSPAYVVDVGEYESKIVPSHKVQKEEVEQIDEISADLAGKYLTAPQGKGANKYKVSSDKSVYPNIETMSKHSTNVRRALKRSEGSSLYKKPDYYKEEVEQIDEVAPPGREDQVKALKKVPGIDNPYAVSWASYRKSHPKKSKD